MEMKETKKQKRKNQDQGIHTKSGITVDGDILLNCVHEHSGRGMLPLRMLLALMAVFSCGSMANAFIGKPISEFTILYYSIFAVAGLSLLKARFFILKLCGGIITLFQLFLIVRDPKDIEIGFFIAARRYCDLARIPPGTIGSYTGGVDTKDPTYILAFMYLLIFITAVGAIIACVFRIDFPILFLFTFPVFEIGMYQGLEAPGIALLCLIVAWVTILSMHIINHTTNRAGRKNTFAVHERSKTFFFTSAKAKERFYPVLMSFIAGTTAVVFLGIMVFTALVGDVRPEGIDTLRVNLHNAIMSFSINNIDGFIEEATGGRVKRNIRSVGGTNGGELGRTNGIAFNKSTALYVTADRIESTMYLRGYAAGQYKDNSWTYVNQSDEPVFKSLNKRYAEVGHYIMDDGYFEMKYCFGGQHYLSTVDIDVRNAERSYCYVPYYSNYTTLIDGDGIPIDVEQKNDLFMSINRSNSSYSVKFVNFQGAGSGWQSVLSYISANSTEDALPQLAKDYSAYVDTAYTEAADLPSLDKAYERVVNEYLNGTDYNSVYRAIKTYLADNFVYDRTPGATPEGEDFIDYFLTGGTNNKGYCTYFATVGAQLLRKFGYPSRYAEGYIILPSQQTLAEEIDGRYRVKATDQCAHAWAEVYLPGAGWVPAEFTPGYDGDNRELDPEDKSAEATTTTTTTASVTSRPDVSSKTTDKKTAKVTTAATKNSGGGSKSGGSGKSTGTGKTGDPKTTAKPDGSDKETSEPMSRGTKMLLISVGGFVAVFLALLVNRDLRIKKRKRLCSQSDLNKRVIEIFRYTLKYLALLGVTEKKNLTDLQITDELLEKCRSKSITELDMPLRELAELAVKAHMSGIHLTESEAATAASTLRFTANKIVAPRLSKPGKAGAILLHCLY